MVTELRLATDGQGKITKVQTYDLIETWVAPHGRALPNLHLQPDYARAGVWEHDGWSAIGSDT